MTPEPENHERLGAHPNHTVVMNEVSLFSLRQMILVAQLSSAHRNQLLGRAACCRRNVNRQGGPLFTQRL